MEDEFIRKSRDKLKELEGILGRLGSMRNGKGGDVFFRGLARTFQANPIIPKAFHGSNDYQASPYGKHPPTKNLDVNNMYSASPMLS